MIFNLSEYSAEQENPVSQAAFFFLIFPNSFLAAQ